MASAEETLWRVLFFLQRFSSVAELQLNDRGYILDWHVTVSLCLDTDNFSADREVIPTSSVSLKDVLGDISELA